MARLSAAVLEALPLAAAEWEDTRRRASDVAIKRTLRPAQIAPTGNWTTWLILAGRGWGKTLTGAEDVARYGMAFPFRRIAITARTIADARDTCVEGESGLLSCLPRGSVELWNRSMGQLVLTNGTRYQLFSAEEPERLRGPQHHRAWSDELAAWGRNGDERQWPPAWDMLQMGLRLGTDPKNVVTTTPKPTKLIRHLITDAVSAEGLTVLTKGRTLENAANLAPQFLDQIVKRYEGTRLGRQELDAEMLDDVPGALWTWAMLEDRRPAPDLTRVVVAIDPAVTSGEESDETGIVVAGLGVDGRGYILADRSCRLSPDGWARRAVAAFDEFSADLLVAEANNGGDLVEQTIRTVRRTIPYRKVHASRGKQTRAQPVAALYEQGRVSHCEVFGDLEDQLTTWTPESGRSKTKSPDRLDALVWALTELMLGRERSAYVY